MRGKEESHGSSRCRFCEDHAHGFDVRLDLGREIPSEIDRFKTLVVFGLDNRLMECPDCGTIFWQRKLIDNEPGLSTVTVEFSVLSRLEADKQLKWAASQGLC